MDRIFKARRVAYQVFLWVLNSIALRFPGNWLRVGILRLTGVKIGAGTRIERGVRVDFPWRLRIGMSSTINSGVYLDCRGGTINIGNCVDLSSDVIVYTLTHDIYAQDFAVKGAPVELLDNVWICARSIVLPGSSIGVGSVIGANSVVRGRVSAHQLWQGNPAVLRRQLPVGRGSARGK